MHWTILFNTFVLMQLFNELNSRKLQTVERLRETWHEWNCFEGIMMNPIFCAVVGGTFILQVLLVQYTGAFFHVKALTLGQWSYCTMFGVGSLFVQFLINAVLVATDRFFPPVAGAATDKSRLLDFDSAQETAPGSSNQRTGTYALWRQDSEDRLAAKQTPGALGAAGPKKVSGRLSHPGGALALSNSSNETKVAASGVSV